MIQYTKSGTAHFYCPTLYDLMDNKHHTEMSDEEKRKYDGEGHSSWTFIWDAGAYHINHKAHGGVPKCKKCGKKLILVAGDNPGHKENN